MWQTTRTVRLISCSVRLLRHKPRVISMEWKKKVNSSLRIDPQTQAFFSHFRTQFDGKCDFYWLSAISISFPFRPDFDLVLFCFHFFVYHCVEISFDSMYAWFVLVSLVIFQIGWVFYFRLFWCWCAVAFSSFECHQLPKWHDKNVTFWYFTLSVPVSVLISYFFFLLFTYFCLESKLKTWHCVWHFAIAKLFCF